jgi:drug/metabolite transporter (DMT)-like permease
MLPIIAMIFSALIIKERITLPKVVGLVIGLAGALLLVLGSGKGVGSGGLKGDLMCLTAQTCIGLYMVIFSSMIHRYSVFTLMKWMFLFSAIVVTIITWPYISAIDYASLPLVAWAEILFIVFCGTFLSYVCFTYGQQVLTPTIVGMYNYVQPIVATVLAVAIGVGRFGWREMLSMALVFGGVYIVNRAKNFERARGNK